MSDVSNGKRNRADDYQGNEPASEESHTNNGLVIQKSPGVKGNFSKGNKHKKLSEDND